MPGVLLLKSEAADNSALSGATTAAAAAVAAVAATVTVTAATTETVTTTTTETVTTTTMTAAAKATATATATGAFFAGTGFADVHGATVKLFAVEFGDGFGGLFLRSHFDECEPTGLVGHLVQDERAGGDVADRLEEVHNVSLGSVERQVADEQLCSHFAFSFVSLGGFGGDLFPTFGFQIVTGHSRAT